MMAIEANGRRYRVPATPTAVVCLDGLDPRYVENAFERGLTPRLRELVEQGTYVVRRSQLPSFTNPNNLSIVTGAPPAVHGLPGNHYLDPDGREVQLDEPEQLRAPTIHARFAETGVPVLAVTTKDKLRRLLSAGGVPCVSAERADNCVVPGLEAPAASLLPGRRPPSIYEWDCSHYALELGLALGAALGTRLLYVSLSDYVQHAAAPGDPLSDRYLERLDALVGAYLDAGWDLGLVADHGMNAKSDVAGRPRVAFLGDLLDAQGVRSARVVLPITDPYVVHHAALGSACWVHVDEDEVDAAEETIGAAPGVEEVLRRDRAADSLRIPADRIGDLVVLADAGTALGRRASEHDLGALVGRLRSHGGRHEQQVPLFLSRRPAEPVPADATNADVHHLLLGEAA